MIRHWFCVALLGVCVLSCARQNYLTVTVENLPAATRSVLVLAASGGDRALTLAPLNRSEGANAPAHFVLALPAAFAGSLEFTVGAYQEQDGRGCLLAAGTSTVDDFKGPRQDTFITVTAVTDTRCIGKSPVLLDASPRIAKTEGGETVALVGFGFQPGVTVRIGKESAVVEARSYQRLSVRVPKYAGFGPVDVQVVNPDQTEDTRKDLLNLYNPTVTLGMEISARSNCNLRNAGGIVGAQFFPDYIDGFAVSKFESDEVDVWGVEGIRTFRINHNAGVNPTNIVAADFDKDGDQDIIIANSTGASFQLLRNDGNFNTSLSSTFNLGANPLALAIGDLDQDGSMDVVVGVDSTPQTLVVWKNDGSGNFAQEGTPYVLEGKPVSIAIGQIDNDSYPDILVAVINDPQRKGELLFNQAAATPRFSRAGTKGLALPFQEDISRLLVGDVNQDGLNDVIAASATAGRIVIITIKKLPEYVISYLPTQGNLVKDISLSDMNGDGRVDLVSTSLDVAMDKGVIEVFLHRPEIGIESTSNTVISPMLCVKPSHITTVAARDNGRRDIVFTGTDAEHGTPCAGMQEGCVGLILNLSM